MDLSAPSLCGIYDFRDAARDTSAGFDIERDRGIAESLGQAFSRAATFNQLYRLYHALQQASAIGDVERVLGEPEPLRPDQLLHGTDILRKVELHAGRPVPQGIGLEDGAGHGFFIAGLSAHLEHLYVVDLSLTYLVLAAKMVEELGRSNVTLICASVEHLPFDEDSIDFVHSNNVIEHVTDKVALVAEAHRVLKPGAMLFILSPNRYSVWIEPHFGLYGFGFIPKLISRRYIRRTQQRDIDDVSLLSLGELIAILRRQFLAKFSVSFLPRGLRTSATGGVLRRTVIGLLDGPVGRAAHFVFNRALLGVMPYHCVIATK